MGFISNQKIMGFIFLAPLFSMVEIGNLTQIYGMPKKKN
jgi:hypothetical protein